MNVPIDDVIVFDSRNVWKKFEFSNACIYAAGNVSHSDCKNLIDLIQDDANGDLRKIFTDWLGGIKDHFGVICQFGDMVLAAADRVGSYQIFVADAPSGWMIGTDGPRLAAAAGLGMLDGHAVLSLAMAGYVTGKQTAIENLSIFHPGEALILANGTCNRWEYYRFLPREIHPEKADSEWRRDLAKLTLATLERLKQLANGRQIVIPLSGGLDSRLIASGVKHLGVRNVICFSYGQSGNFEAATAQKIAEKLGYSWHFVPMSIGQQKRFFASDIYRDYLEFSHDFVATPFQQDLYPLHKLLSAGLIDGDAVIVNGNSGDFISGAHIPKFLCDQNDEFKPDIDILTDSFLTKHYSLWEGKFSQEQRKEMQLKLIAELREDHQESDGAVLPYALWERLEFIDRQSKYVVSGQRIYDFLNLDWQLPLWSDGYLDFWASVPLRLKADQRLYKDMLQTENWGDVWHDIPANNKTIRPSWIIPLRLAAKAACAPFGRKTWHRFEKRFFAYWMDWGGNYAITPFRFLVFRKEIARNSVALHSEAYLSFIRIRYKSER